MLSSKPVIGAFVLIASTTAQTAYAEEDRAAWRVFIADQATSTVTALDLDVPERRWRFDLQGPSKLYASPSGQTVIAVQSDHDRVNFIRSGITLENHGEHSDIKITDPAAVDAALEGPRPFHVVAHGETTAINFDKGGYASFLQEHDLTEGRINPAQFTQSRAHHGFSVPLGGYVISSVPSDAPLAEGAAPSRVGIAAFDNTGAPIGEMQVCTDLHGEAFSGAYLVAGCKEGVVAIHDVKGVPDFEMLPYPADFAGGNTGTLLGSTAMQMFLGNYGANSVVIIDPTEAPYFTRVDLPFRRVDFVMDPVNAQFAYILTEDGSLHRLNMLSGEIVQTVRVSQPYSMDGHWRDPRPRLAMAGDRLLMTDPLAQVLRVINPSTFDALEAISIEGLPYNIVAIGGSGLDH